ncbi:hypothetical protein RFI_04890 [Reticulomyxa filosa]|uniref:Transmembrane protein n=1 Tax=Reticulomyxa filosa TaxID=46433 RepID=X6P0X9_RETFI|nr:hypothetical protein RFI_04890 [Reticulomyxa filosa]|eukprot:ETO32225.1 hypothetical protein RFI_04890 [Reticulomyxa filosa]
MFKKNLSLNDNCKKYKFYTFIEKVGKKKQYYLSLMQPNKNTLITALIKNFFKDYKKKFAKNEKSLLLSFFLFLINDENLLIKKNLLKENLSLEYVYINIQNIMLYYLFVAVLSSCDFQHWIILFNLFYVVNKIIHFMSLRVFFKIILFIFRSCQLNNKLTHLCFAKC